MFERFTDRARRVVVLSQEEARLLGHNYIGPEHILLALIREGSGVATQVLTGAGVDLNRARQQVIELLHGQREEGEPYLVASASSGAAAPQAVSARLAVSVPPAGDDLVSRLASFVARLNAIELRLSQSGGV
jgi:ATP-dependent Clp protease ATP-binding subunit ClpA